MTSQIKLIPEDDWYKTATQEEMRIALMHVEIGAIDSLRGSIAEHSIEVRIQAFDSCSKDCGWDKKTNSADKG